jgi:hypothetical protein
MDAASQLVIKIEGLPTPKIDKTSNGLFTYFLCRAEAASAASVITCLMEAANAAKIHLIILLIFHDRRQLLRSFLLIFRDDRKPPCS